MEKDEEIEKLKEVFQNYSLKDDSKYAITNSSKIQDLLDFIQNSILLNNNNEQQSIMFTLKFISKSFTFFRINIDIFQQNINKNIYIYFIDIYLDNNNVNSNEINPLILKIIDVLVNNLSISKKIIYHIIQKYSYYFYELNVNKDNIYPNLKKLLEVTIHLLGIYLNIKKPKCFYFLTEKDNIIINIDKNDFKDNIGITFWFKSYLDNNCELINFCSDDNKVIKLFIEKNILYILLNEIRFCIGEKIALNNEWNCLTFKFENVKLKKNLNVYLNDKHVLKSYYINNDSFNLENFEISKIILGNNFYGEITSIIILSNTNKNDINTSLLKKLSLMFPFGIITNKDVSDLCKNFESFKNIIKFLYVPFGKKYNLINNIENNLEFNNFHI